MSTNKVPASLQPSAEGLSQIAILEQIHMLAAKMDNFQLDLTKVVNTTTDLDTKLNDMVTQDQLRNGLEAITYTFRQENSSLKKTVTKLEEENDDLRERMTSLETLVGKHSDRLDHVKYKSTKAIELIDDLEQHGRANSIRIYGISDTGKNEGPKQTIQLLLPFFSQKLGINLEKYDIDTCHRLGPHSESQEHPRGIICKFVRRIDKDTIIKARRQLIGSGFVIKEDLTTKRRDFLGKTANDKDKVKKAWSSNGRIVAEYKNGTTTEATTAIQEYLVNWEASHKVIGNVRSDKSKKADSKGSDATANGVNGRPSKSYSDALQAEHKDTNDRGRSRSFLKGRRNLPHH